MYLEFCCANKINLFPRFTHFPNNRTSPITVVVLEANQATSRLQSIRVIFNHSKLPIVCLVSVFRFSRLTTQVPHARRLPAVYLSPEYWDILFGAIGNSSLSSLFPIPCAWLAYSRLSPQFHCARSVLLPRQTSHVQGGNRLPECRPRALYTAMELFPTSRRNTQGSVRVWAKLCFSSRVARRLNHLNGAHVVPYNGRIVKKHHLPSPLLFSS